MFTDTSTSTHSWLVPLSPLVPFALLASLMSLILAFVFALPLTAYANVRKTDSICGTTVEARGLDAGQCPDVSAERSLVMDADGTVYFERNATDECHIASITKIMTAIVAVEYASLDTTITVSKNAAMVGESSAGLQENDELTLQEALKALMWPSGNDAAIAIAENLGALMLREEGEDASNATLCQRRFVRTMNETAQRIGMTNTTFTNPHGLDEDEFADETMQSTARDVATMTAYASNIEAITAVTSVDGGTCTLTRAGEKTAVTLASTDELLSVYDGVIGMKTGTTDSAGKCFAGVCERDGVRLIAVSLGCEDEALRFIDCQNLWDWAYKHRIDYPLVHADEVVNGQPVVAYVSCKAWPDTEVAATLDDPAASITTFELAGNISESADFAEPTGSVEAGDTLGTITYYQRNTVVATANLVAAEDMPAPNPFKRAGIWVQRLFGYAKPGKSYLVGEPPLIYNRAA